MTHTLVISTHRCLHCDQWLYLADGIRSVLDGSTYCPLPDDAPVTCARCTARDAS